MEILQDLNVELGIIFSFLFLQNKIIYLLHFQRASILAIGKIVKSPASEQLVELLASSLELIGICIPGDYPLAKKEHTPEFLRSIAHLRVRTNTVNIFQLINLSLK